MVLQPKDVIVLPVSDEVSGGINGAMVAVFRASVDAVVKRHGECLNDDDPRSAFALMVTALVMQADAINRMVDLILEPGAPTVVKVGREVREAVRRRVREVFRETLDA